MIAELENHLWQSTLFAVLVALLTWTLRRNRAAVRYGLWLTASVKFLVPFAILGAIAGQFELPSARVAARQVAATSQVAFMEQISEPFARPMLAPGAKSMTRAPHLLPVILFCIWLCGFAANCLSWWRRWRRMHAVLRTATPAPIHLRQCGARIRMLCAAGRQEPGVFGIFDPVLLLPEGIAEHLTAPQLQAILAHELCHIRRRDNLAAAVHMIVECLFWFHPVVWWLERRLLEERERACDEDVLASGIDPQDYCDGIVNVCRHFLVAPLVCVAGVTGGAFRRRIEGIMSYDATVALSIARKLLLAGAGVFAIAPPILIGVLRLPTAAAQSPAESRNILGAWQGSLAAANRESRVVFSISLEGKTLKAVMYRIDQGGPGTPVTAITQDGSLIKMTFASIGGIYEGKLTPDGKTIVGTWTQGTPLPLRLVHATPETAWAIPDAPPPPQQMAADADPVFEVATIKPSQNVSVSLKLSPSGLFESGGTTLAALIKFAYDLHPSQIVGGPSWLQTEKYDVTGKPDKPGRPGIEQLKAMIRKLLADRFQLTSHHEKSELPVYAIRVAKSGAKLIANNADPNGPPAFNVGPRALRLSNATMTEFARILQAAGSIVDRPVVDQTGLGSAKYDLALRWTPVTSQSRAPGVEPAGDNAGAPPDLFIAFQEQLGLKLESTKALIDVLVIDGAKKPSAN